MLNTRLPFLYIKTPNNAHLSHPCIAMVRRRVLLLLLLLLLVVVVMLLLLMILLRRLGDWVSSKARRLKTLWEGVHVGVSAQARTVR